ncbi:MAG: hypothetical protein EPO16_00060 [Dehalococcoidia bacterium]|nr:MAG: hypothetical protein EPO16_00060 [Dehalococcoidia bacterium]
MRLGTIRLLGLVAMLAVLGVAALATVRATANTVASSHVSNNAQPVTANQLKPSQCDSLNLTTMLSGSGNLTGTTANELLLGSSATQQILGGGGDDCLVGGAGADLLQGDAGTDVCIGNSGSTFTTCETTIGGACSTTQVSIGNFYFNPNPVTINAGCTIRWTNTSSTQHNSRSDTGVWSSPNLARNAYYEYTFNVSPGTYTYKCTIHPTQTGSVIVQ